MLIIYVSGRLGSNISKSAWDPLYTFTVSASNARVWPPWATKLRLKIEIQCSKWINICKGGNTVRRRKSERNGPPRRLYNPPLLPLFFFFPPSYTHTQNKTKPNKKIPYLTHTHKTKPNQTKKIHIFSLHFLSLPFFFPVSSRNSISFYFSPLLVLVRMYKQVLKAVYTYTVLLLPCQQHPRALLLPIHHYIAGVREKWGM